MKIHINPYSHPKATNSEVDLLCLLTWCKCTTKQHAQNRHSGHDFHWYPISHWGKGSPIFLTQSMHNTKAQKWILSVAPETSLHNASQLLNLHDIAQQSYYCLQDLAVRPSSKSETVLLTHKKILLVSMEFFCL